MIEKLLPKEEPEELDPLDAGKIVLASYASYMAGKLTGKKFSYFLAGVLSFVGGVLSKGCEWEEKGYTTEDVGIVKRSIGNEFSDEVQRSFLKVNSDGYYIPKAINGKLESFLEVEEIVTETKTGNTVIRGTQYNLTPVGKAEMHIKR